MLKKLFLATAVLVCLLFAAACDSFSTEPGSFVVLFQWETGHEPDTAAKEYYIWAYYQEWKGGEGKTFPADIESNAKSLDEAGPVKLGSGDDLNFTKLTYGNDRFVRAAIWDNADRTGDPLYVGVSELFDFSASDRNKAVAVNMKLQANAGVDETGEGGSFAIEVRQGGVVATRVGQPTVTLRFTVKNADAVIIANDLNFEKGVIEKKLTELTKIDETTYELADWDFTEGWTDLGDALYSVFGKSKNTLGYESAPKRADVYLDTTAPVPNVTPFPTVAKLGDIIEVRFSFDEEVDPAALEIAWGGLAFTLADNKANKSYTYTYTVTDTDDEQEYTFSLTASDGVGNATEAFELGKVTIDRTLPSISGITVAGTGGKETLRSGDILTVNFTASEELSADPVVKIDDKTLTLSTKTGLDYTYTYTVTGADITGIKTITASLRDLAKNDATVSIGQTIFDNILPLIMGVETTPARAKKGIPIEAVLSFSEPVDPAKVTLIAVFDDDPTKEIAFTLTGPSIDDQSFSFSHTVDDLDLEGNYTIRVEATDTAGNEIAEDQKEVGDTVIDKTAPTVSDLTIGGINPLLPVKEGTVFTVSFTVSEEIKPESLLEIGKLQVRLDAADCTASGLSYQCTHTVDAAEGDGTKHVAVAAVDLAGNLTREPYIDPVIYDTADPVLINAFVNPADRVGLGQKLVVLFSLSETPSSYDFDGDGLDFTGEVTPDGLSHTYTHIVAGTDAERTYNFTASVTDLAGNTLDPVSIGSVFVDITPPDVAAHDLSATNVKLGAEFTLSFTVTEELKGMPAVLVGAKNISSECTVDGLDYTCTHAAGADEGDGVKQIAIQLTDLAGNTTSRTLKDAADQYVTIEYDVTAPDIVNPVIAPEKANLGAVIDVRFSFTEDVEGVVIDWGALAGKFTRYNEDTNKRLFIYKHTVDGSDDEGIFPVNVTAATDMAGNPIAGTIPIGSVEIDNSAPTLSGPDVKVNGDTDKTLAKEGDTVTVTFAVAETIAEHTVRIGLIEVTDCAFDSGDQSYTCTYTVTSDGGEGVKDVTVELKDEAGNADTYAVGQVTFDMTDAELANAIILPTKSNKATAKVEVKFSFTEEVVMTALVDGGLGLSGTNCPLNGAPRRDFVCTYTFDAGDTQVNDYPVTVSATDKAGNTATGLSIGTVSIDRDVPSLIAQDVTPTTLKLGDEFIISFTASETLEGDPIVKVGALQLGGYTQKVGNAYEYRHTAAPEEGDGSKLITVAIQDPAGNGTTVDLIDTVTYDTTAPAVLNPTVSPETANRQTTAIDVRFSFPEDVEAVTLVGNKLSGDAGAPATGDFACVAQGSAKSWKCTASLVGVTWEIAVYELWVNGRDMAGNYINPTDETNGQALGLNAVIDRKRPVISGEAVTQCTDIDCTTPKTISKADDVVRVSFEIDETPATAPVVAIAGRMATACSGPATYDYCIAVQATDGDGEKEIRIETVDAAGNVMVKTLADKPRFDVTAPAILNPIVTPQKANGTSTITATFSFSEEILPGAVSVASAGGLSFACSTADNKTYTCTRSVTDDDGAGYAIVAAATDAAGNSATGLSIGAIEIDRNLPDANNTVLTLWNSDLTVQKTVVKALDKVQVTFTASEPLKDDPKVQVGGQPMTKTAQDGLDYTYQYPVQSTDGDGQKTVRIELTDLSDNTRAVTAASTAPFDVTAPSVLNPTVSPAWAKQGAVVTASFSFTEPIAVGNVTISGNGALAFTCTSGDNVVYSCTHTVGATDAELAYALKVAAVDTAGNTLAATTLGTFTVDRQLPAITAETLYLLASDGVTPKTVVKAGDKVRYEFDVNDTLGKAPIVTIGGNAMTTAPCTGSGTKTYSYCYTVQSGAGDGSKTITTVLEDRAANVSTVTAASTAPFDVTAPAVLNPTVSPAWAKQGATVTASFSFTEPIASGNVTISGNGALAFTCTSGDNVVYSCTHPVGSTDTQQAYTLAVAATDAAGNTMAATTLGTFTVDRTLPAITGQNLYLLAADGVTLKTPLMAGDKVRYEFDVNDTLGKAPTVTIGGGTMTATGCAGTRAYAYCYTVLSTDGDGSKTITVALEDRAANQNTVTAASTAPFDVTKPVLISPNVTPTYAKQGAVVTATFNYSEAVASMTFNWNGLASGSVCNTSDNKSYTCTHTVLAGDTQSTYNFTATATDAAGNTTGALAIGSTTIDRTAATIGISSIVVIANSGVQYPDGRYAAADGHIVSAEVTITTTETLAADPVLDLGGFAMTQVACAVPATNKFCYTHTVEDTEGEGNKFVSLTAEDRAGNVTVKTQLQAVVYDFSGPRLVSDLFDRIPSFSSARDVIGKIQNYSVRDPLTNELVSVLLSLYADEIVDSGRPVTLNGFSLGSPTISNDQVTYYKELSDADAAGTYPLTITWSDRLGNTATRTLSWKMAIDKTPTNSGDLNMELVRFIRIPYGSEDTAGLPRYQLEGDAGARLDSNIVMITAYTASGSFAGQTTVNADNSFYMPNMSSGNVETVYLNPISRTGASMMPASDLDPASDLLPVENTRYIATMGYKVAGSDLANPHEWQSARNTAVSLVPAGMNTSVPVDGTLLARNDASSLESGTVSKWIQLPTDVHPNASWRTNMCYDAARDRLVLFGGLYMYLYNETWEWYDGKWNAAVVDDPEGDGEPIKLQAGQMAYDNRRGVCVYYGGSDAYGTFMDKTWEWNGRSWKRIYPSDPEGDGDPIGIGYGGMAYDIHRGVMVLAGGAWGGANSNVYEYDGESWREMPRMSDSPSGPGVNVSYDRDRRVMVAAGGSNLGDKTVEYSGQKWTTVCGGTTGCTGAPSRDYPMMAYDAKRKVTVHFGGRVGTTYYNELREWNGTSWTLKSPTGDVPAARAMASMAYHEGRQTVILYGGIGSGSAYYFDTWEWDGTKWTRLSATDLATPHPTAKTHYALAYDQYRKVLILHGGKFSSSAVSGETWEWNGYAWKQLFPTTTVYRYGHSLVFNNTNNNLLLFGGRDDAETYRNDVYYWNGTNWYLRSVSASSPSLAPLARMYHSAAYDSVRNRMVIFGGMDSGGNYTRQLYEWDNTNRYWYYQTNSTIEARIHAGMTYDPVKQRIIVFGGEASGTPYYTGYGDTWEYNGATYAWTKVVTNPWVWGDFPSCPFSDTDCWDNSTATQSPMPRWGHMMVYDPTMRRTILSGGMIFEDWSEGLYLEQSDTWVYNSATTSWNILDVANGPAFGDKSLIYFHKGYYDTTKGEVASWGGVEGMEDAQLQYSKTNVLRTGASEIPSQIFTVSLDAAGLAEGYAWRDIVSLDLSVYAGATVYGTTCTATNGVALYGWANDRWLLLDQSPAARTAVTELKFSVNKPELIQKLLNGEASELYFKIEAKDKAGCGNNGDPLIAVDYAELSVDIREDTVADRYYVSTSQETWADARIACGKRGMDLAVINSQKESDLIEDMIPSTARYYWIGLNEPTTEGSWMWVNGLPAWNGTTTGYGTTWTDWAIDSAKAMVKPSDTSALNCGLLYYYLSNWIWWDWGCNNATYYICEKRDYSYSGVTGTRTTNDKTCDNIGGGRLVRVNSELEEDHIWPFVTAATVKQWIGLSNTTADSIHIWNDGEVCWDGNSGTTGTAYGFTHWGSAQPDNSNEDCTAYDATTHDWYDEDCATATYGGICEY